MHCQNLRSPIKLPLIYHLLVIIINTNRQNIIALQTPCVSPRSGNVTSNAHAQRKWPAGFPSTSDASSVISLHHRIETVGTGDTFVSTHSFLSVWWYIADGVVGRCWHCLLALLFVRIISDYLVLTFYSNLISDHLFLQQQHEFHYFWFSCLG